MAPGRRTSVSGSDRLATKAKPEVDTGQYCLDVLGNLESVVCRNGPRWEAEEYVRSPEIQIIVLHEHRPVGREHVF
jgi:hypothetical protein